MNNKTVIEVLKDVLINRKSLDEAKDILIEFYDSDEIIDEIEYIEDNFEESDLVKESIKLLIDNIENKNVNYIEKPSIKDLESVIQFIDNEKLLLKNMVIV